MANTYELIASNTIAGTATKTVTFSAIPATYNDIILKASARSTSGFASQIQYTINGGTADQSRRKIEGVGSGTPTSESRSDNNSQIFVNGTTIANTFSYVELYFPSYAGTVAKPFSGNYAFESSGSVAYSGVQANLLNSGSAISSIALTSETGNFAATSSFFLYGIKKT